MRSRFLSLIANVGFEIENLIEPQPIFALIMPDNEMFETFNMGVGFCYSVDPAGADQAMAILKQHGRHARRIGHAVVDREKIMRVPQRGLVGRHKTFTIAERTAR